MTAHASKRAVGGGRSFWDVLTGLAAIAALIVLLAGVPIVLIAAFGLPVPHTMPSLQLLTHRLDLSAVLGVCSVVVWLAWLQLVWCVVAEVVAAVRNTGMPARVPLAGATQALVHRLVTTALLLSTASALTPALLPVPAVTVASATPLPGTAGVAAGAAAGRAGPGGYPAVPAGGEVAAGPARGGQAGTAVLVGDVATGGLSGGATAGGAAPGQVAAGDPARGTAGTVRARHLAGGTTLDDPTAGDAPGAAGQPDHRDASDVADVLAAAAVGPGASGYADPAGHRSEKIYIVEPPEGRFHESLWEIAARHLGDGRRYREIFEMNAGRTQPDGTKLTIASLIRPGWVLMMPHDAHGPGIRVLTPGHRLPGYPGGGQGQAGSRPGGEGQRGSGHQGSGHQGSGRQGSGHQGSGRQGNGHQGSGRQGNGQQGSGRQGNGHQGSGRQGNGQQGSSHQGSGQHSHGQPGSGQPGSGQNGSQPGQGHQGSGQAGSGQAGSGQPSQQPAPARTQPAQGQPAPGQSAPQRPGSGQEEPGSLTGPPAFPLELAAAGLLGAGVLAALAMRRRRQRGQRRPGRRLALPGSEAAWAEAALRFGADENAAGLVDAGLRFLSQELTGQGRTRPTVFAAHVGEENLDLWVAPPSPDAPHPWFAVGDGQVWRLSLASVLGLPLGELDQVAAPYPGLVSIGTDPTGRVLVDVVSAHGLIAVTGPDDMVRDALTAMAVELATSRWSEGIHLTLVGFGADLAVLAPDQVEMVPTLAEALPGLETWAAEVSGVLGNGAAPHAPAQEAHGEARQPHYLISAVEPASGWERDRLLALAQAGQAAGAGYLTAGDVPGAAWTWELSPDGRLRAGQLGLDVSAQAITHEQQVALADMFEASGDLAGVPLSAPPPLGLAPARHLLPQGEEPVEVTLLGPVSVRAPGQLEADRLAQTTEIVAYLATHPGGVHPNVLTAAIWPRGVTDEVRDAALDRVMEWLGSDGVGRPHLARDTAGRFRLGSGVRVDWQVFCTLVLRSQEAAGQAPTGSHAAPPPPGARGQEEASLLEQALSLVAGPFLADRAPGRYAWLAVDGLEYEVEARVADAAHRLCELRLAAQDPHGATAAGRIGLRAAPDDELLWRDLIIAAYRTGEEPLLRSVVGEICEWARVDDRMPGLAPETEALIDELLPSWRWSVA
jgi:hypothetical protein